MSTPADPHSHRHHDHDHDHHGDAAPHRHPPRADSDDRVGYYQAMEIAVRDLLIEKGVITADDVRRAIEAMDARTPAQGGRIVARAWLDPAFKARLLADGNAAARELDIDAGPYKLIVVENTPKLHNMIVCTLCSCYPWEVLGLPPVWYKSAPYRSRAVKDPRGVLADFGVSLPKDTEIRVWDSTAETRFIVLPMRPAGTDGWSEERLADLVTRDSMIGTGLALPPGKVAT